MEERIEERDRIDMKNRQEKEREREHENDK